VTRSTDNFFSEQSDIEFIYFKNLLQTCLSLLMLALVLAFTSDIAFAASNESFSKSKKQLKQIYQDHQTTFYCDCPYNYDDKKNMIDKKSCGYKPRLSHYRSGKINTRSNRIEWEHIISTLVT